MTEKGPEGSEPPFNNLINNVRKHRDSMGFETLISPLFPGFLAGGRVDHSAQRSLSLRLYRGITRDLSNLSHFIPGRS